MRFKPRALFTIAVLMLFGYALFEARSFGPGIRIYPLVAGTIGFGATLFQLILDLRRSPKTGEAGKGGLVDIAADESLPPAILYRRAGRTAGWLIGLYLAIWLLGVKIAFVIFSVLFMRLEGRIRWPVVILLAVLFTYLPIFLFEKFMSASMPESLLQRLFELPGFLR